MYKLLRFRVDGQSQWVEITGVTERLSGVLRLLGTSGPRADCGTGQCGACTVMIGDHPMRSCRLRSEDHAGAEIWTADHLDHGPVPHPMLLAFRSHGVPACETCMPGLLIAAIAYAALDRELTEDEIHRDLVADLCRCGSAGRIVAAIRSGAEVMHGRGSLTRP